MTATTIEEETIDERNDMNSHRFWTGPTEYSDETTAEEHRARLKRIRERLEATHNLRPLVDIWGVD